MSQTIYCIENTTRSPNNQWYSPITSPPTRVKNSNTEMPTWIFPVVIVLVCFLVLILTIFLLRKYKVFCFKNKESMWCKKRIFDRIPHRLGPATLPRGSIITLPRDSKISIEPIREEENGARVYNLHRIPTKKNFDEEMRRIKSSFTNKSF